MPGFELFGDAERKEVNDVLESGVLMRNGYWKANELEKELEKRLNVKHAQLTTSGTTDLNTALAILGVGAGDEVIMPTFTFGTSFESILNAGATPILVEIDDTLTLDPKSDDYISRNISCLIKLSWTEKEVLERAENMVIAIKSVL